MRQSFLPGTNPVLSRELRVALRNARSFALISIYVAILGAVVIAQFPADQTINIERNTGDRGRELFGTFIMVQAFLVLVLLPALSAGAISIEHERQTLEPLLLTPLTPMQVVWGKAAGVLALSSLLVLSTLPLTSLCFLLGGVSPSELIAAYALLLGLALFTASIGLYCSARWHKTMQSTIACYLMLPVLILIVGTLSLVGTPIMGIWAIGLPLTLIHGRWKSLGQNRIARQLGIVWWLSMWIVLIGLGFGAVYAIFAVKNVTFMAFGLFVVLYLLFVTQLGLQQAAREIARAPGINQPLRVRVQDLQAEWQQAIAPPTVTVGDRQATPAPGSVNSGFKIGVTGAAAGGGPGPAIPVPEEPLPLTVPPSSPTSSSPIPAAPPLGAAPVISKAKDPGVSAATTITDAAPAPAPRRPVPDTYGVAPFLSDKLNPIFAKDLRSGLLGKSEYLLRFSYVATIGTELLLILVALTAGATGPNDEAWWFRAWALFHFFMLLIAAGWLGARAIAPEHEQQTLEQLVSAPLTSAEIVRGKIMAVLAYTLYVWVMGAPMVLLLLLVGSIKLPAAVSFVAIELVFSLLIAAWGMYCSIHLVTVRRALGYTLGGLFTLIASSLFASSAVSEAISSFFSEKAQAGVNVLAQAFATMISPMALMGHALVPPGGNIPILQRLPLVPGALLMGCVATVVLWWLTMRAFDRYTQNL